MKIEIIQFLKSAAGSNLNFWQFLGLENDYRICCVRSSFTSCCGRVGGFPLRKSFRRRTSLRNLSGQRFVLSRPCRNGLPFQRETEPDKLFWWRKNSLSSSGARWATISLNESINFENDEFLSLALNGKASTWFPILQRSSNEKRIQRKE